MSRELLERLERHRAWLEADHKPETAKVIGEAIAAITKTLSPAPSPDTGRDEAIAAAIRRTKTAKRVERVAWQSGPKGIAQTQS